jgi:hypothetical protein
MSEKLGYTASDLERYLVGELDEERTRAIDRAAEEDGKLKAWIADRRAERHAFLLDPRRKSFAKLLEEAKVQKNWIAQWWPGLSLVAAAAVVAAVFVRPPDQPSYRDGRPHPSPQETTYGIRNKGGLSVQAAVLEGDRSQIFEGEKLHPGNRLRLSVDDPRGGWVTVILEESNGEISVLYQPEELGKLRPGTHRLPDSLELDEELGRERIYVLVSDEPPKLDVWMRELKSAHQKAGFLHGWLPEGTTRVSTVEYEKVK